MSQPSCHLHAAWSTTLRNRGRNALLPARAFRAFDSEGYIPFVLLRAAVRCCVCVLTRWSDLHGQKNEVAEDWGHCLREQGVLKVQLTIWCAVWEWPEVLARELNAECVVTPELHYVWRARQPSTQLLAQQIQTSK